MWSLARSVGAFLWLANPIDQHILFMSTTGVWILGQRVEALNRRPFNPTCGCRPQSGSCIPGIKKDLMGAARCEQRVSDESWRGLNETNHLEQKLNVPMDC